MKPEQRSAKWEMVHPELTNMHLQADGMLPACFHCSEMGCTFRNATTNSHQAFWSTATHYNTVPTTEPTRYTVNRNAQSRESCSRYNRGIFCSKPPCQFTHACNRCNQGHPGSVNTPQTLHSFLQHSNPLPTQVSITILTKN